MTNKKRSDFGGDTNHDVGTRIFEGNFTITIYGHC